MNIGLYLLWFWAAYMIVTLVGIGHTIFNWKVLKMDANTKNVSSIYDIVSYARTVPFHPIYNIILWPIFAFLYLSEAGSGAIWKDALILGASWALITIIIDLIGWVLIKHPWRMTFKEMYVDYQPWISLIYITIFASPFIAGLFIH